MTSLRRSSARERSQTITRVVLGSFMTFAGISHLTFARDEFQAQVPDWMPVDHDLVVLGSGVVEISLGAAMLALPKHRRVVGIALAAFYVLIFPGNIAQYVEGTDAFGLDTDGKRLARLFGQPLLIAAALWAAGPPGVRMAALVKRMVIRRQAKTPQGADDAALNNNRVTDQNTKTGNR